MRPDHSRQGSRVTAKLERLQHSLDNRIAEVRATSSGIDPSQVIVIETIGSVQDFSNAVSRIPGFEWMGEYETDEIAPDEDFYNERSGEAIDSPLRGRLYLVLTDQVAIQQLLTLWNSYSADVNMRWPTGLTPLRDVFNKLHDIRRWGIEDRLYESGALDAWRESLELAPAESIRTEIELWYRSSAASRAVAEQEVAELIRQAYGSIITRCTIDAIGYHAMLVELPRNAIAEIVDNPTTELVQCDSIMFFRPTGQMVVGPQPESGEDPSRPFYQMISPLARLLDWLSHKYGVLFVISAGNQTESIDLGVTEAEFRRLTADERERLVVHKLYENRRSRRLLAPAESINGLTVNASHCDSSPNVIPSRLVECYETPLPSPLSSFGGGYRRAIKPEVVFPGGRAVYSFHYREPTRIDVSRFRVAPGNLVASPGTGGDIERTAYTRGTSNAAALVSRSLAVAHDALLELFAEQTDAVNPNSYLSPLLKALLVHTADWNIAGERLGQHLESIIPSYVAPARRNTELKHLIGRWLGYGHPNTDRMLECTAQRAKASTSGHRKRKLTCRSKFSR